MQRGNVCIPKIICSYYIVKLVGAIVSLHCLQHAALRDEKEYDSVPNILVLQKLDKDDLQVIIIRCVHAIHTL